jgi:solute carrier family 25 citrate transporter 1
MQQALLDYTNPPTGKLSSTATFGLGAVAGLITVCKCREQIKLISDTTMPLDNIKTRMQSLGAETRYRNSLDCLVKVSWV